ncbi:MAG: barstar family protein [Clostridia bacterium]|nr:barstar family protein [Clostridia bacterium]
MNVVFLDGARLTDAKDVFDAFRASLPFAEPFADNLDALHDALTSLTEPVGVIAVNTEALKKALGRRAKGFRRLMDDLKREMPTFSFTDEPFRS